MSYFDGIKEGDRVWDFIYGEGKVYEIEDADDIESYVINVKFKSGLKESYNLNGRRFTCPSCNQSLFWDKVKFDIPERPKIELKENKIIKHGDRYTRLYNIYQKIKQRCYNKNHTAYKLYGGSGITMCDEWYNDYTKFRDWALKNGYADNLTIDRINSNSNYEPSNCRWVDKTIQLRNRRIMKNNTTGFIGVSKIKNRNRYEASIQINKKRMKLGWFELPELAAISRDKFILENYLEDFPLNFKNPYIIEKQIKQFIKYLFYAKKSVKIVENMRWLNGSQIGLSTIILI